MPSFTFTTRLVNGSDEYAKLVAQTTGTAVLSVKYDANNSAQWTWQQISYQVVENTEADGIVACYGDGRAAVQRDERDSDVRGQVRHHRHRAVGLEDCGGPVGR